VSSEQKPNKSAVLDELYYRIAQIAEAMDGTASPLVSRQSLPSQMVATPSSENVQALWVRLPDEFQVEFAPSHPLSIGNALSVRAVRTHAGLRKSDWTLNFGPDGWRRTQAPLSDDEIRACLTPEGPSPAAY
jgi:hypothetical protein